MEQPFSSILLIPCTPMTHFHLVLGCTVSYNIDFIFTVYSTIEIYFLVLSLWLIYLYYFPQVLNYQSFAVKLQLLKKNDPNVNFCIFLVYYFYEDCSMTRLCIKLEILKDLKWKFHIPVLPFISCHVTYPIYQFSWIKVLLKVRPLKCVFAIISFFTGTAESTLESLREDSVREPENRTIPGT